MSMHSQRRHGATSKLARIALDMLKHGQGPAFQWLGSQSCLVRFMAKAPSQNITAKSATPRMQPAAQSCACHTQA